MSLWEYKVISSGKGGFATPALLEKFLNDLGRDEWEIVEFRTSPDNLLAFSGLARRTTQRDWTLQDAAAAAAKAEAEKLRAEFEAKFKAATTAGPAAAEERAPSFLEEKAGPDDGFRKPVDTSHDDEPEEDKDDKDDWDKLTAAEEDELPTFFEAIKPHMRRNQRGPGMSVGVDYLAKKWDQAEDDIKAALVECGFVMPEDEDSKVEHLEYDGDLYWLNINRRGELWINTKEKPRPIFRAVKGTKAVVEEQPPRERERERDRDRESKPESGGGAAEKTETGDRKPESGREAVPEGASAEPPTQNSKSQNGGGGATLPAGADLLAKIRPHMRRNRRGPGGSGSTTFLSRALRTKEDDLKAAFVALGLTVPAHPNDKPVYTEIGNELWWLNLDSRGGLWINGREKKRGETAASAATDDEAKPGEETKPADDGKSAETTPASGAPESAATPEATPPTTDAAATSAPPADSQAQFVAMEVAPTPAAVEPAAPTPVPETTVPVESAPASEATPPPPVDTIVSDAPDTPRAAPEAPAEGESAAPSATDAPAEPEGEKKTRRPRTRKKAE